MDREYIIDMVPSRVDARERHVCQGWRCTAIATWNRWAGLYCYDHAIRAGWLPGVVRRTGAQLAITAAAVNPAA